MEKNCQNDDRWFVVVNPNAGSRKILRNWDKINKKMMKSKLNFDFVMTRQAEHAIELTGEALKQGYKKFIAVGGDGTLNEMVNALLSYEGFNNQEYVVGLIPVGTGNDWGRMFNIPNKYKPAIKTIKEGNVFLQDIGVISYFENEQQKSRYFVNIAGMGYDAVVAQKTNRQKAAGKSNALSYFVNLFTSLFHYKSRVIDVEIDEEKYSFNTFSMSVGICKYNGGGMMQLPNAIPDDGLLDVTIIKKIGLGTLLAQLRNLYTGQFVKHPKVATFQANTVKISSKKSGFMMEADGESLGHAPFEVNILPKALKVLVDISFLDKKFY
jgi:diacylglycerol kinase (ATP)